MKPYTESAVKELIRQAEAIDFNYFVLAAYDSHENKLTVPFSFQGHPDHWGPEELTDVAFQISDCATQHLKTCANDPKEMKWEVKTKKFVSVKRDYLTNTFSLFCFGIAGNSWARHRIFIALVATLDEFGFGIYWYFNRITKQTRPFWSFKILLGPIVLSIWQEQ